MLEGGNVFEYHLDRYPVAVSLERVAKFLDREGNWRRAFPGRDVQRGGDKGNEVITHLAHAGNDLRIKAESPLLHDWRDIQVFGSHFYNRHDAVPIVMVGKDVSGLEDVLQAAEQELLVVW